MKLQPGDSKDEYSFRWTDCMIRERHSLKFDIQTKKVVGTHVTNTAHRCVGGMPTKELIDWNTVWQNVEGVPEQDFENDMVVLPVVCIWNKDGLGTIDGESDYKESLINLQKNINKLYAIRQLVIDMSEQPLLVVPSEYLDEDGKLDMRLVRLRTKEDGEEADEIQVTNWTGNLENSKEQVSLYREEFHFITGLSPTMAGLLDSQARSGLARRLGMVSTEAEITSRRHQWNRAYKQLIRLCIMLENTYGTQKLDLDNTLSILWPEALPQETSDLVNSLVSLLQSDGISPEMLVAQNPLNEDLSEEERQDEITRIKAIMASHEVVMPTIPGNTKSGIGVE
jgi:hypothetical protein